MFFAKTNYTFDVSMCEIFLPLQCGATLVMAKAEGQKDVEYLEKLFWKRVLQQYFLYHPC